MPAKLRQPISTPNEIIPPATGGLVDTFVPPKDPGGSPRSNKVFESLQRLRPSLAEQATRDIVAEDQREATEILSGLQGMSAEENAQAFASMVKSGDMALGSNPWVQAYTREQGGRLLADRVATDMKAAYLASPAANGSTEDVATFAKGFIKKQTKLLGLDDEDVASMLGFTERMSGHLTSLRNQHVNSTAQRTQVEIRQKGSDDIRNYIQTIGYDENIPDVVDPVTRQSWVKAGKSDEEIQKMSVDMANRAVADHIFTVRTKMRKLGVSGREINKMAVDAITSQARMMAINGSDFADDVLNAADHVDFGEGRKFNQIGFVSEALQKARVDVEQLQSQRAEASRAAEKKAFKDSKRKVTDEYASAFAENDHEQLAQIVFQVQKLIPENPEWVTVAADFKKINQNFADFDETATMITRSDIVAESGITQAREGTLSTSWIAAQGAAGLIDSDDTKQMFSLLREAQTAHAKRANGYFRSSRKTAMSTLASQMTDMGFIFDENKTQKIAQIQGQIDTAYNAEYQSVMLSDLEPEEKRLALKEWTEEYFGRDESSPFNRMKEQILNLNVEAQQIAARQAELREAPLGERADPQAGPRAGAEEKDIQAGAQAGAISPRDVGEAVEFIEGREEDLGGRLEEAQEKQAELEGVTAVGEQIEAAEKVEGVVPETAKKDVANAVVSWGDPTRWNDQKDEVVNRLQSGLQASGFSAARSSELSSDFKEFADQVVETARDPRTRNDPVGIPMSIQKVIEDYTERGIVNIDPEVWEMATTTGPRYVDGIPIRGISTLAVKPGGAPVVLPLILEALEDIATRPKVTYKE